MEKELKNGQRSVAVSWPQTQTRPSESERPTALQTSFQERHSQRVIKSPSKDADTSRGGTYSRPLDTKASAFREVARRLGFRTQGARHSTTYEEEIRTITAGINVKEKVKLLNSNAPCTGPVGWRGSQKSTKKPDKIPSKPDKKPSSPKVKAKNTAQPAAQHDSETEQHIPTTGRDSPQASQTAGETATRRLSGTQSAPSSLGSSSRDRLPRQNMHHPHLSRTDLRSSPSTREKMIKPIGEPVLENEYNYIINLASSLPGRRTPQGRQSHEMRPINILINDVAVNVSKNPAMFKPPYKLRSFARRLQYTNQEVDELLQTNPFPGDEERGKYYSDKIHRIMISWKNKRQLRGEYDLEKSLLQHLNDSGLSSMTNCDAFKPLSHAASRVNPYVSSNIVPPKLRSNSYPPTHEDDSGFHSGVSTTSAQSQGRGSAEGSSCGPSAPMRQAVFQPIAAPSSAMPGSAVYAEIPGASTPKEVSRPVTPILAKPKTTANQHTIPVDTAFVDVMDLAHKRITNETFLSMAPSLSKTSNISKILLNGNHVDSSASIAALAQIIATSSSTLKVLDLSGNKVGDRGWRCLLPSLSKCSGLESISLSNCNLSAAAIPSLHNITGVWLNIKMMNVSCNDFADESGKSTAAWTSLANRIPELNVYFSGIGHLETSICNAELANCTTSNGGRGRGRPHLPLYVRDALLNGIYIGPGGGQLRHGPVKLQFPAKCVKKVTWIRWPSLTFFGRSLALSGHEITMGPGIEIGPSQEFDEPITVVVYDSRISSTQEPIVLVRQSSYDHYTDLSDKAKLNAEGAYLMFTTIHFTEFRCGYCEKAAGTSESLGRRLKELTSEDITVLLNQFDRKQVLVFTAEYLEFEESYQVCLRLHSVPIAYGEDEEREKVFKPSSGFLWTGGPLGRYPVVDPAEYDFHVTLNPSSPDVQLSEPISSILRCDPVEATYLYVVKKTASRRLQGQAMCHFQKRDAADGKVDSILFYVDMPEKGGHRNRSLVVDSTGCSDYKDLPMKQSTITADSSLASSDEAESPWQNKRFSREFYKRIIQINPTLLRTEAVSEGMLTDQMAQLLQAPQNQAPCTHNTLLLDLVKPNGVSSFEQFLSVLKNLGYEPLWRDLQSILPIGHHLRRTADGGMRSDGAQSLAVHDPLTHQRRASSSTLPMCQA